MKPNPLLEQLGFTSINDEAPPEKPEKFAKTRKSMRRSTTRGQIHINDDAGKPINIKISKQGSKIRNLFAKKLTQAALEMEREKLEQFEPTERFLMQLIESHKPNELVEYFQDMQKEEDPTSGQDKTSKPSISKTGTV